MSKRKNQTNDGNPNNDFCEFLTELANYEKNINRNIHKYSAYRKAAGVIAAQPKRLQSGDEAKKLSGVGEKIAKKIDEFLQTGKLQKLETIRGDEDSIAISLLTRVSGIGPAKAKELVVHNIKSLDDLEKNKNELNHHQLLGLKYFNDFELRIPRSEIEKIEQKLKEIIFRIDSDFTVTICGSYRRGKTESGDIDMLLTHPSYVSSEKVEKGKTVNTLLKKVVRGLDTDGLVTDTISMGYTKFMGVCRLDESLPARRLDIRLTPFDQYDCAVLYFTGSDVFNKTMRTRALENGFTLNEYTLRPVGATGVPGEPVPTSSEEDIFDYINYPYKKPEDRNM